MNYQKIYNALVSKRRKNPLQFGSYSEKHHIVPKCLGGGNDAENLVRLTLREHFIAHRLLVKIHPNQPGLQYALWRLAITKRSSECKISSHAYQKIRGEFIERISEKMSGRIFSEQHRKRLSKASRGRTHSGEARRKISEYLNANHPWRGRKHSQESKNKMSISAKGWVVNPITKQKQSEKRRGELNANCRLTPKDVLQIRSMYKSDPSEYSQKVLAEKFGVKQAAISKILTLRTWKHLV